MTKEQQKIYEKLIELAVINYEFYKNNGFMKIDYVKSFEIKNNIEKNKFIKNIIKITKIQSILNKKNYLKISNFLSEINFNEMILIYSFPKSSELILDNLYLMVNKDTIKPLYELKNRYSRAMYDFLSSYKNNGVSIDIKDIKKLLHIDLMSYQRFNNFRDKIINPVIKELNKETDLFIEYETILKNKKVNQIYFRVISKIKAGQSPLKY